MILQNYSYWKEKLEDKVLKEQFENLTIGEINNAFFKYIQFGTGGLRGEIGVGTNSMNIYTIRKATQGICDYLKNNNNSKVVISYDSRINSELFARTTAEVFCLNGLEVFISKELMPTPFVSFAIRELVADVGIMITASHNPSNYNGYKVYGADGGQCTDNAVEQMSEFINRVDEFDVKTQSYEEYLQLGRIHFIPESIEEKYIENVLNQTTKTVEGLNITYTPLNGTGYRIIPLIWQRMGIKDIDIVKEQGYPDGLFATCKVPNPEKKEALSLGLEYARRNRSDLLIATDPDSDRVGVVVRHKEDYTYISGNEMGALLVDYIFTRRKELGTLPKTPIIIKTIVTSDLGKIIAEDFGARTIEVLTGFKYIGESITELEKANKSKDFIMGYEESYGYLIGDYVRDKDAGSACAVIAEMAFSYLQNGKTLVDRLVELYDKYGYFQHELLTFEFKGAQGYQQMKDIMLKLRSKVPNEINQEKVIKVIDYLHQKEVKLPISDVLQINMENGTKIIFRPSGTEPLIKVYLTSCKDSISNQKTFEKIKEFIKSIL